MWLITPEPVYFCNFNRTSKNDPVVDAVEILQANPTYARVKKSDGRETSVSPRNLDRCPDEEVTNQQDEDTDDQQSVKETGGEEHGNDNEQKDNEEKILQPTLRKSSRIRERTERWGYDKV